MKADYLTYLAAKRLSDKQREIDRMKADARLRELELKHRRLEWSLFSTALIFAAGVGIGVCLLWWLIVK